MRKAPKNTRSVALARGEAIVWSMSKRAWSVVLRVSFFAIVAAMVAASVSWHASHPEDAKNPIPYVRHYG